MKKALFIILSLIFSVPEVSANSLDELYRDLIKSDNEGYLPLFVKNRKVPDILTDDKIPTEEVMPAPQQLLPNPPKSALRIRANNRKKRLKPIFWHGKIPLKLSAKTGLRRLSLKKSPNAPNKTIPAP